MDSVFFFFRVQTFPGQFIDKRFPSADTHWSNRKAAILENIYDIHTHTHEIEIDKTMEFIRFLNECHRIGQKSETNNKKTNGVLVFSQNVKYSHAK